jgi:hypothetical protein
VRKYIVISILFFTFLLGCKKVVFTVPDDVAVYVHRFENEASLRGKTVDLEKQGLKIEFTDFTGKDYSALCHYDEKPVRIQIDQTTWNLCADTNRELILFHELGHGFLGIHDHRNDTLPDGDWKSIMRGTPADVKSHPLDYALHREYYLDELFLDKVKTPAWAFRHAVIEVISSDFDFGLLLVNTGKTKIVTLKNKGSEEVVINSIKTLFFFRFYRINTSSSINKCQFFI